jgi:KDO2-lipid IV(A) lauroyltransferase
MRRGGGGRRFTLTEDGETYRADPDAPDAKAEARRLTDALNAGLGRMIMQAPEQWFWIHRRWKNVGQKQ